MNKTVGAIWGKTPEWMKPYIRYVYYATGIPFNYPKNLYRFRYINSVGKKERINYIPSIFVATISTACNLRCPSCLYLLKDSHIFENGSFIRPIDFRAIIEKYGKGIETFSFTGGEPLLHPEFDVLVGMARGNGFNLRISTNGILIDRWIDALRSFSLNVSVDGYNYESYARFRGGTKKQFDEVIEGLSLLKKKSIEFGISFVLTQENLSEVYEMLKLSRIIQPSIVSFHNINPHGSKDYTPLTINSQTVSHMAHIMGRNDYPFNIALPVVFDIGTEHFEKAKCGQPWHLCCFDSKGDISFCCHLKHNSAIGNILGDYDFNSIPMRGFRRLMARHQYPLDCRYCHRRSMGEKYGSFNSEAGLWK